MQHRPGLGISLILLMALCFAAMDSLVKLLGAHLSVLVLLWARYAFQALVVGVWLLARGRAAFHARHPKFQLLRGSLLTTASVISFYGLQLMPVAEFTAVGMLSPVVVTLLAAIYLHESVSGFRWALVGCGFVGALIVIRPGSGVFGWAAAMPLLMALANGSFQALTARLAGLDNPLTTHFYTGLVGMLAMTPVLLLSGADLPATLQAAPAWQLGLLLALVALGTCGHLCLILAMGQAPTSTLMPFAYAQIAFAVLGSGLLFGHLPDAWAWLGMAVIAASGASTVWLNVRAAARLRRPIPAIAADPIAD